LRRLLNLVVTPAVRLGIGPRNTWILTVPGRRSGRLHSTPVTLAEYAGERWLVAPAGEREWVKNARASGRVGLTRGRRRVTVDATEVPPEDRAGPLKAYAEQVPLVGRFFDASPGAPEAMFAAEAVRHPVFRLRPQP
jgi:deazaflavin-dependent oxidoreductase (nitroreductase family)